MHRHTLIHIECPILLYGMVFVYNLQMGSIFNLTVAVILYVCPIWATHDFSKKKISRKYNQFS